MNLIPIGLLFICIIGGDARVENISITLRASVRIAADVEYVRLADVATIKGEDAEKIGDVVIGLAPRSGAIAEFSLRQIRSALDGAGVHWGRTHLSGRSVIVRANAASGASAPLPMTTISLIKDEPPKREPVVRERPAPPQSHLAAHLIEGDDLRSAIAEFMVHNLGVEADALQLVFDDRDGDLLRTPLDSARFQIEPVSNIRSARIELAVRQWDGDRIIDRQTLNIAPTLRTPAVLITRALDRSAVLTMDDLEVREQWLAPNVVPGIVANADTIIGRMTSTRLREGDLLRETHLQRETIVRRGELVTVRCIVGGAVISLQAEARANAAAGEIIEFRKPGDRETFLATVTGRGVAVVDLARRHAR